MRAWCALITIHFFPIQDKATVKTIIRPVFEFSNLICFSFLICGIGTMTPIQTGQENKCHHVCGCPQRLQASAHTLQLTVTTARKIGVPSVETHLAAEWKYTRVLILVDDLEFCLTKEYGFFLFFFMTFLFEERAKAWANHCSTVPPVFS